MYYTSVLEQFAAWLEASTDFFWCEVVDVATANDQFAQKGTFTLGLYGVEGVTIGAAPTDGLIEAGLTPTALGESYEGVAYPFEATAAGALSLGTVTDLLATDQVWVVIAEVNGTSVSLTPSVGGTAATAVPIDATKGDIYALPKAAADNSGALAITLASTGIGASSPVTGYVLVGRSVTTS